MKYIYIYILHVHGLFLWLRQGYDYLNEQVLQDLTSSMGFVNAMKLGLRVESRGLFFLGLPCNSHTAMTCSQHQRSAELPLGNQFYNFVVKGNCIGYRAVLLVLLGLVRGCLFFIENPSRSGCIYLPVIQHLLSETFKRLLGSSMTRWWGPCHLQVCFNMFHVC